MSGDNGFEIVPASERPTGLPGNEPSLLAAALIAGQTAFLPGLTTAAMSGQVGYYTLRHRGLRMRTRMGERGGVRGVFVWAEPRV